MTLGSGHPFWVNIADKTAVIDPFLDRRKHHQNLPVFPREWGHKLAMDCPCPWYHRYSPRRPQTLVLHESLGTPFIFFSRRRHHLMCLSFRGNCADGLGSTPMYNPGPDAPPGSWHRYNSPKVPEEIPPIISPVSPLFVDALHMTPCFHGAEGARRVW